MEAPKIAILETTVSVLKERRLNLHAAEVEKCIQYIQMKEAGIPTPSEKFVSDNAVPEDTSMPLDGMPAPMVNHTFQYGEGQGENDNAESTD